MCQTVTRGERDNVQQQEQKGRPQIQFSACRKHGRSPSSTHAESAVVVVYQRVSRTTLATQHAELIHSNTTGRHAKTYSRAACIVFRGSYSAAASSAGSRD